MRFAADKYEEEGDPNEEGKEKEKMKKTQFLTNTSVGKSKQSLASLTWSFAELRKYWKKKGKYIESALVGFFLIFFYFLFFFEWFQ